MKSEETLRFLPLQDGKQPLFMWTMIAPLKILPDPLIAGRIVSVFSGLGTLVGVAVLSYLLFKSPPSLEASEGRGKKMAIVASAIYALSPYAFFFDRLSTADSMLAMFGVWTFIFSYLAVTKTRLDYAMLAGFALGGAWLTKSPALFFALLLPTLWLFTDSIKKLKKIIPLTLVTVIIGYGMYNILRLGPNFHQLAARNADYVYPLTHIFQDWLNPFKTFLLMSFEWIWMMGPFSIIVLWLLSYFINWKKDRKILLVLTVWFLGPIFVQAEFAKVFTARYIFFTIPYLFILAAGAFNSGHYKKIRVLGLIFILFSLHSIIYNNYLLTDPQKADMHRSERSGYLEEWTAGQGTREVADFIRKEAENIPANKKVVVGTEGYFGTLPDGLQIYFDKNPKVLIIGVGLSLDKRWS